MSTLMTMALGVVGSFVGGGLSYLIFGSGDGFQPSGWIMSIIGAIVVLVAYSAMMSRKNA